MPPLPPAPPLGKQELFDTTKGIVRDCGLLGRVLRDLDGAVIGDQKVVRSRYAAPERKYMSVHFNFVTLDPAEVAAAAGSAEALISRAEAVSSLPGGARAWAFLPDAPAQGADELVGATILINVASVGWQWATLAELDAHTRVATVLFGGDEKDYDFVELSPATYCRGFDNGSGAAAGAQSMEGGEGAWAVAMKSIVYSGSGSIMI